MKIEPTPLTLFRCDQIPECCACRTTGNQTRRDGCGLAQSSIQHFVRISGLIHQKPQEGGPSSDPIRLVKPVKPYLPKEFTADLPLGCRKGASTHQGRIAGFLGSQAPRLCLVIPRFGTFKWLPIHGCGSHRPKNPQTLKPKPSTKT